MSISNEAIAALTERLKRHADKTFDIANDLLVNLFDGLDDEPIDGYEEVYNLIVEAEEHVQRACRRIDEAEGIVRRKARA